MGGDTPVEQTCFPAALRSPLTHSDVQPRSHRQRSPCSRSGPERCSECTFIFIKRCQKHDPPHFETHLFSKYLLRCPVGQAQGQALPTRQGTDTLRPLSLGQASNATEVQTVRCPPSRLQTGSSYIRRRSFFHPQPSADVWARWALPDF